MEKKESEYENTIKELQYDISQLREELQSHQHQGSTRVKESSMAIRELTLQNERLTEDMRVATLREEELEAENQTLREKISARSSSMHAHVGQLEHLQQEVGQIYICLFFVDCAWFYDVTFEDEMPQLLPLLIG